jgi:hypothetical protein
VIRPPCGALTQGEVQASGNALVRFVGIEAYEAAGGVVRRDLFDSEQAGWISDPELLRRLATEKLEGVAELGRVNTTKPIGDEHEVYEADEQDAQLLEASEDAAIAFEAPEQALDLVATLVHRAVVLPGLDAGLEWRHNGNETQIERELARLVRRRGP